VSPCVCFELSKHLKSKIFYCGFEVQFRNCITPVPVLVLGDCMLLVRIAVDQSNLKNLEIILLYVYALRVPSA
jgi:hypothetical protein